MRMNSAFGFRGWIACWGAAGLSACSVGPDFKPPETELPGRYIAAIATAPTAKPVTSVDLTQWWRSFRDPQLVSLVERSIAANPDIAIALARLQQARATQLVATGAALPNAELSAGAAYGTGTDNTRGRVSDPLHSAGNTTGYNHVDEAGGLDTAWELDIFGKLRREIDRRNIESARRRLEFVQSRFSQGLTNELDVTLVQRQIATFEAGLGPLTGQLQSSQYVIAVLLGQYPETLAKELRMDGPVPRFPAKIPIGLPVSLLQRRADIQQAEFEIGAATARMGSAVADLFPRVAVTSAVGGQGGARAATGIPITFIGGIGPALYWPVLDFGTLDARIEVADYRAREALLRYKANVLGAVQEVDQAIAGYNAEQNRLNSLSRARSAAVDAVKLSSERYERGLTDFLNVLDAERQQFELEAQYVIARRMAAVQLVALYKAIGGGWEHYQAVPPIRNPEPAIAAAARESNGLRPISTDLGLSQVQP